MTSRAVVILAVLVGVLIAVVCVAAMSGAVFFAFADLWRIVLNQRPHDGMTETFLMLRLPRVVIGVLVGAALAVAGALLQALLRNPLVDPYLTGSSAGASCAIALGIACHIAFELLPALAFIAALGVTVLTMALARVGRGLSPERLIMAGVALSALGAAIVTLVILLLPSLNEELSIVGWLAGTLAGRGWPELRWAAVYAGVGFSSALLLAPTLNVLRLGHERAHALGVNQSIAAWSIVATAALLTAAAVSLSGMLGFIGLLVPNAARRLIGNDARVLLPASGLLGAASVVLADDLARTLMAPLELPLGVLLAFVGVPAFLGLAFRRGGTNA